ncbi:winged helix-turn-helix domain-containing protein [Streptomyces sp. NPDC006197]|uniref:helix-turn-helix domain-containing protein n=1 Tax=Streptomyces sp. NPDC006197 TaxID=3156685 RepID=UPI0033B26C60
MRGRHGGPAFGGSGELPDRQRRPVRRARGRTRQGTGSSRLRRRTLDPCPGPDGDSPASEGEPVGGEVWRLPKRHGWPWQTPARRALERDEHTVELWKREVRPQVKDSRRRPVPGSPLRTRPDSR